MMTSNTAAFHTKKAMKDNLIMFVIRWWTGGAIYFLIGWGTRLGSYSSLIDLVFFLGLAIGLVNTFLVNPALKMLYNIGWHKSYGSSTVLERVVCRIKDISMGFVISILVMYLYDVINLFAFKYLGTPEGEIFLPGEPILYGLFCALFTLGLFKLFSILGMFFKRRRNI